jgi:hypothetical protein
VTTPTIDLVWAIKMQAHHNGIVAKGGFSHEGEFLDCDSPNCQSAANILTHPKEN